MTQIEIPDPGTLLPTFPHRNEWYRKLKRACPARIEENEGMENLLGAIRKEGVYGLGSSELREASATLLQQEGTHSQAVRWLLKRLQHAGLSPSYPCYTGTEVLTASWPETIGSGQAARNAVCLLYNLAASLLEVPELHDHPRRDALQRCVDNIMEKCRENVFSRLPLDRPPENVINVSLLPESSV